ncbi:hypothetical protein ACFO9Q_10875 [Paenibacillus sp. GCM10023252]|uniref:hypothetical protein n=1 Tax=Paenibacillus sp. GCM10023252 TaxID=3252649 RepID=UPI003620C655
MIPITKRLIDLIRSSPNIDSSFVTSYTNVIVKYGGLEDAYSLFKLFIEVPADYNRILLLEPIMMLGDLQLAQEIYDYCFYQKDLKEGMPSEVLHVLGHLGFTKCTETLVSLINSNDWHISKDACLGLLHLPCNDFESYIKSIIDYSFGKSLFQEFVPALSYKISNNSMVSRLFEWGDRRASTDCNAGIILGIALFGNNHKNMIKNILWNQNWEAHDRGTGTCIWSYISMQHVELTFGELIQDIKSEVNSMQNLRYRLDVLSELLECKLTFKKQPIRFTETNKESIADIYRDLFDWSDDDKDDSIIGIISNTLEQEVELLDKYYHLREKIEMKIEHNIEVDLLRGYSEKSRSIS